MYSVKAMTSLCEKKMFCFLILVCLKKFPFSLHILFTFQKWCHKGIDFIFLKFCSQCWSTSLIKSKLCKGHLGQSRQENEKSNALCICKCQWNLWINNIFFWLGLFFCVNFRWNVLFLELNTIQKWWNRAHLNLSLYKCPF